MPKELKVVWREDPINLSFLAEGMAEIANEHTLVVCIVESTSTIILITNKKNIGIVKTIFEKNKAEYTGIVKIKNKTGFTFEISDLKNLEEAFKKAGIKISKIERKEIKA
ncbi:hypothetical protein KKB43_04370 [Patescibacteria group bacterium]|nr:hypothetical protein [Patescibacteria group bacterium]MBU4580224.1 hypothetical protein [Patescibacteria group bacterium]